MVKVDYDHVHSNNDKNYINKVINDDDNRKKKYIEIKLFGWPGKPHAKTVLILMTSLTSPDRQSEISRDKQSNAIRTYH